MFSGDVSILSGRGITSNLIGVSLFTLYILSLLLYIFIRPLAANFQVHTFKLAQLHQNWCLPPERRNC